MLGPKSGVAKRLKDICPCVINFHCPAHRLQLAIMDIADHVSLSSTSKLIIGRICTESRTIAQRCLRIL
jgi:hypothetical protein